jgi:hypothetical protein
LESLKPSTTASTTVSQLNFKTANVASVGNNVNVAA